MRGARPVGPLPRPSAEPVTAQRVASNTGVIMIAGQKIALGRIHARRIVTVHVAVAVLAGYDGAAELERGLDILLTGLTATLTPPGQTRPPATAQHPAS